MILIWIILIGGGFLIGKLIASFLPNDSSEKSKSDTHIYHNTINETHNHLHVSKDDLKDIIDKK